MTNEEHELLCNYKKENIELRAERKEMFQIIKNLSSENCEKLDILNHHVDLVEKLVKESKRKDI